MRENFRTFNMAVEFYRLAATLKLRSHLKEQLSRASSSIALNLAEGRGKASPKDQANFFQIAFGSVRECQAILVLAGLESSPAWEKLDCLAAHLYQLIKKSGG